MKSFLLLAGLLVLLAGCATTGIYRWGDYSNSLYRSVNNPGDESLVEHQETLLFIIADAEKWNSRVPPGVYYELGYSYLQQGHYDEADRYFELETATYPESAIFVQSYLKMLSPQTDDQDSGTTGEEDEGERD